MSSRAFQMVVFVFNVIHMIIISENLFIDCVLRIGALFKIKRSDEQARDDSSFCTKSGDWAGQPRSSTHSFGRFAH